MSRTCSVCAGPDADVCSLCFTFVHHGCSHECDPVSRGLVEILRPSCARLRESLGDKFVVVLADDFAVDVSIRGFSTEEVSFGIFPEWDEDAPDPDVADHLGWTVSFGESGEPSVFYGNPDQGGALAGPLEEAVSTLVDTIPRVVRGEAARLREAAGVLEAVASRFHSPAASKIHKLPTRDQIDAAVAELERLEVERSAQPVGQKSARGNLWLPRRIHVPPPPVFPVRDESAGLAVGDWVRVEGDHQGMPDCVTQVAGLREFWGVVVPRKDGMGWDRDTLPDMVDSSWPRTDGDLFWWVLSEHCTKVTGQAGRGVQLDLNRPDSDRDT